MHAELFDTFKIFADVAYVIKNNSRFVRIVQY